MKKFIEEFKEFAARGNVIDLAVAVIIGNAINKIVSSLVNDIFTPILGIFVGRINITSLSLTISSRLTGGKSLVIGYGNFLQSVINFLTITFCIFIILKGLNKLREFNFIKAKENEAKEDEQEKPTTEELLMEIRDLLRERQNKPDTVSDIPDDLEEKQ